MVSNLPTNSANIFQARCKLKLANLPNPLNQGISHNPKPQRKSRFTIQFPSKAERESNQSRESIQ
jgi:hypothetical protein